MVFKKGNPGYWLGKKRSKEDRENFRLSHLGKKTSEETKRKMSESALKSSWNRGLTKETHESIRKQSELRMGSGNPCWKGGRPKSTGYIMVKCEGHPRAHKDTHYIKEHILVMEKKLGRLLTKEEVIHHKNRIRDDNRPENLQLFENNVAHLKYHREKRKNDQ